MSNHRSKQPDHLLEVMNKAALDAALAELQNLPDWAAVPGKVAAQLLGVSLRTLANWRWQEHRKPLPLRIKFVRVGRQQHVELGSLRSALQAQSSTSAEE